MTISDAAAALYAQDPSAVALGIELVAADESGATVRMPVRHDMCNGFDIVHGGVVFLLADSAMAFASNSQPDPAVATSASIDWLAQVRAGQTLTAVAERRWSTARSAVWDITISTDDGDGGDTIVALFRGRTRTLPNRA